MYNNCGARMCCSQRRRSHLHERWTGRSLRTPSVELPNRTFALLLVRSCQIRSPKSECSVTNSMFRSTLSDQTPRGGPHERASDAPVTRSYPRGTAGFTLSPSTGGTKTGKSTVIPDVITPICTGKPVSHDLSSNDKARLDAILGLLRSWPRSLFH